MSSQLVSIIIPVHNAAGTLEAAVRSALSQTDTEPELILVDDGAEDGSGDLCEQLAKRERRIRVFHMEDRGVSAARNLGLSQARGTRVTFLDADDVMHPRMLSVLSAILDETGAEYAGCGFERREGTAVPFGGGVRTAGKAGGPDAGKTAAAGHSGESGEVIRPEPGQGTDIRDIAEGAVPLSSDIRRELRGAQILTEGILRPDQPDTRIWSKLFRREYIGEGRFREGLTIGEDFLFLSELVREDTRYVYTQAGLYSYYINPKGAMERPFAPNHMDHLHCWEYAEEGMRRRFPELLTDPDNEARLAAKHLIAAVLTASKIARLPSAQQSRYDAEFEICRQRIRTYDRVKGVRQYLPEGYALKMQMILRAPGLYRRLYH